MSTVTILPTGLVLVLLMVVVLCISGQAHAFGAGNIPETSLLDGHLWRHGDIADLLINLPMSFITNRPFKVMDVKVIYFGNWLRDYSQLLDVGGMTKIPEDILRSIGYKQTISSELRGPVKDVELEIDPEMCMKNYTANEGVGIDTSSKYIRSQLRKCIQLGRAARTTGSTELRNESFIHLGAALHTLEDFAAHSNYVELALQKCGEQDVFAYVADNVRYATKTASSVAPIVTGTFGQLDLLQSILGEIDDKSAATNLNDLDARLGFNPEIAKDALWALQVALSAGSALQIFSSDIAGVATSLMNSANNAPKHAADWDALNKAPHMLWDSIEPIFAFRDRIAKSVNQHLRIPFIQPTIAQISAAIDEFTYSLLAAYIKPIIQNVREELESVTSEVAKNDAKRGNIFASANNESNPSHSQLAKDHFNNVLNSPAGLVATAITNLTTQLVVRAWDDEKVDAEGIINEILKSLHHPFNADPFCRIQMQMLATVEVWWNAKSDGEKNKLRRQLSKDGVQNRENLVIIDPTFWATQSKGPAHFEGSAPKTEAEPELTPTEATVRVVTDMISSGLDTARRLVPGGVLDSFVLPMSPTNTNPLDTAIGQMGDNFAKQIIEASVTIQQINSAPLLGNLLKETLAQQVAEQVKSTVETVNDVVQAANKAISKVTGWFRL